MSNLKPVVELGVEEAYLLLSQELGVTDLPPLDAIENEDWGRDHLLSRLGEFSPETLAQFGLIFESDVGMRPDLSPECS